MVVAAAAAAAAAAFDAIFTVPAMIIAVNLITRAAASIQCTCGGRCFLS